MNLRFLLPVLLCLLPLGHCRNPKPMTNGKVSKIQADGSDDTAVCLSGKGFVLKKMSPGSERCPPTGHHLELFFGTYRAISTPTSVTNRFADWLAATLLNEVHVYEEIISMPFIWFRGIVYRVSRRLGLNILDVLGFKDPGCRYQLICAVTSVMSENTPAFVKSFIDANSPAIFVVTSYLFSMDITNDYVDSVITGVLQQNCTAYYKCVSSVEQSHIF